MKLRGSLIAAGELSPRDRETMFALMDRYYAGVARDAFEADLAEKQWVIQVRSNGELCGFSTQMLLDVAVEGRSVKALFSGDTIIDRAWWGDPVLMQIGGQLSLSLIDEYPHEELYWFLISAGYKTYRFLPVFFREFHPRYDRPLPREVRCLIDGLATSKFADRYDPVAGVVRADSRQYYLRDGVAEVGVERLRDPHVQFFVERNPGHARGDELCCVARLSRENFTPAAYRVLAREARR
jgi:hypothetical protein